ncbi:MAG: hypothetical protein ACOCXQ_04260 [Patescibacteria group bacterium]
MPEVYKTSAYTNEQRWQRFYRKIYHMMNLLFRRELPYKCLMEGTPTDR